MLIELLARSKTISFSGNIPMMIPPRFDRLAIAVICSVFAALYLSAAKRPNIVFVFSDDHATQAISAYGGILAEIAPTPNLDKLAAEGMRFTRCMVTNSICGPSRATILTGKYSK